MEARNKIMAEEKEKKKKTQADKMYGDSPKLERDEGGKMGVKKKSMEKKDDEAEGEDEAGTGDHLPVMVRHSMERHEMNSSHEREHHMHDMGKHGDKKEMHDRHEKMRKDLHTRHEKEMGSKEKTPEMGKD
jgi:hypothetical protein